MEKWKDCNQDRVVTDTSNEVYGDDNGELHIDYYCPKCMARQWNCSLAEAQSRIRDTQPHLQKRRWQSRSSRRRTKRQRSQCLGQARVSDA